MSMLNDFDNNVLHIRDQYIETFKENICKITNGDASREEKINDMGYKIINLEGKPFNDGMTIQAHFVVDENLKDGETIIKRVIKPQINFNENLIQVAEVEVAQGV